MKRATKAATIVTKKRPQRLLWPFAFAVVLTACGGGGGGGGSSGGGGQAEQQKIVDYANDNTKPQPGLTDYSAIQVTGVIAANLAAINSAVDALVGTQVDSRTKVQTMVDAYVKILNEANGVTTDASPTADPTLIDYASIGAAINTSDAENLGLLNDIIKSKSSTDVDTILKINELARVANAIQTTASGGTPNPPLTAADFELLGISGVTPTDLTLGIAAIAAQPDDGSGTDTLAEVQGLVVGRNARVAGFYNGTAGAQAFETVIVDTGHFYLIAQARDSLSLSLYYGRGIADASFSFASPGIRRFPLQPSLALPEVTTLASNVVVAPPTKVSINGTLTPLPGSTSQPLSFSGNYDASYDTAPSLTTIQGTYFGDAALAAIKSQGDASADLLTLTIAADGTLSGSSRGCNHTGTMVPHPTGGNVYNVILNYRHGANCASGTGLRGHAVAVVSPAAGIKVFVANDDFSKVLFYTAGKQ